MATVRDLVVIGGGKLCRIGAGGKTRAAAVYEKVLSLDADQTLKLRVQQQLRALRDN